MGQQTNIHIIRDLKGEQREKEEKKAYQKKKMAKNFPNLGKDTDRKIQKVQIVTKKDMNQRDPQQDTLSLKRSKVKGIKDLKSGKDKTTCFV